MALNIQLLTAKFAAEAAKHCDQIEKELLSLEAAGFSSESLDAVFRTAHTIKGAARMLKLTAIAAVAHRMEDVFELLRTKQQHLSQETAGLLLAGVDTIRQLLAVIAAGNPLPAEQPPICQQLEQWLAGETSPDQLPPATRPSAPALPAAPAKPLPQQADFIQIRAERLDELIQLMSEMISLQYRKSQQTNILRDILRLSATVQSLTAADKPAGSPPGIRELTDTAALLHSQLMKFQTALRDDTVMENLLTSSLQEQSLKIRMLPLTALFDKINRVIRDLSASTGKAIDFQATGGETELDRKIIEQLGDCLLHMVRNAVDHGIELPQERLAAGKQARGSIRLSAFYDAGGVSIVLQDDGGGICLEQLKTTAIHKQLLTQTSANTLTETELLELLFLPGFSTSPIITDISGRGVGMNVVKQTVTEILNGSVSIQSQPGKGTTMLLKVPITLSLSRMLLVTAAGHSFALPADAVQEILLVPASQIIHVVTKRALRVREQIVPLEELAAMLRCPQDQLPTRNEQLVLILATGHERLALAVDAITSEADMVIKPVPAALRHCSLLSGFTVGGQDEIISVLSAAALLKQTRETTPLSPSRTTPASPQQRKTILVVDDSANTRDIVKSILESYSYQVDLAQDGLEAIEKTGKKVYDAVITDIEMPQLDGFSLTAHLRQDERYRQIPIIIVTSREKPEDKRRGIQVGANAYIVKGAFDQNNLIETLQNIIG